MIVHGIQKTVENAVKASFPLVALQTQSTARSAQYIGAVLEEVRTQSPEQSGQHTQPSHKHSQTHVHVHANTAAAHIQLGREQKCSTAKRARRKYTVQATQIGVINPRHQLASGVARVQVKSTLEGELVRKLVTHGRVWTSCAVRILVK